MSGIFALIPLVGLAFIQDFLTGMFGAPSIIATMIASRAMGLRRALLLSTVTQFVGVFLFGSAVAVTVGASVVKADQLTPLALYAALGGTVLWMLFSRSLDIPTSSTHTLIGGLVGAAFAARGAAAIDGPGLLRLLVVLIGTAPLGLIGGFVAVRLIYWLGRLASPNINRRLNQGQWIVSTVLGLAIGSNNGQNTMGMIALSLLLTGVAPTFSVPFWAVFLSALGLALGNLLGGTRLTRSIGARFFQIRPIHGFSAEVSSALIIAISSWLGGDVSTTHVTNLAIVGAGAGERLSMVRWGFVQHVLLTWLLTIPATAVLSAFAYWFLHQF